MRGRLGSVAVWGALAFTMVLTGVLLPPTAAVAATSLASECKVAPVHGPVPLRVGAVDCLRLRADDTLGGLEPFSYFVPPACAPQLRRRCPVLYFLHGTNGFYNDLLGKRGASLTKNPWVRSLSFGPVVDPHRVSDPWDYSDPSTWRRTSSTDMIMVAPHGLTLPGGFGPGSPGQNGFWADWNPKYAKGGPDQRYPTPPPRWDTFLTTELVPFVDEHFPAIADRTGRALVGLSMGGIGALANGLRNPDMWSAIGSISGTLGTIPDAAAVHASSPIGVGPPVPVPYMPFPSLVAMAAPAQAWTVMYGSMATVGNGDPVSDEAYYRDNDGTDLVPNALAFSGTAQSTYINYFNNDTVPRRAADFARPSAYAEAQAFESVLTPMAEVTSKVMAADGVAFTFEIHPGIHLTPYWAPYLNGYYRALYDHLQHWDGAGHPAPDPTVFDYRTVAPDFSIWGWHFTVDRTPQEFLNISEASCAGLTLRGSGTVHVVPAASCNDQPVTISLGPAQATDEPMGAGSTPVYGRTVRVALHRR